MLRLFFMHLIDLLVARRARQLIQTCKRTGIVQQASELMSDILLYFRIRHGFWQL